MTGKQLLALLITEEGGPDVVACCIGTSAVSNFRIESDGTVFLCEKKYVKHYCAASTRCEYADSDDGGET